MEYTQKDLTVKLFYNKSNSKHYVQMGDMLIPVKENLVKIISEKQELVIRSVEDVKHMQTIDIQ